jgi:HEXXH motif-containing protein
MPGLIQVAALNGPVAALEGLVHESAHHHFRMLEAAGPISTPHDNDRYPSPLRADPRPLRNVLLATHALQHVVAFYDGALEVGLLAADWSRRRNALDALFNEGVATVSRNRSRLTPRGRALLKEMRG